MKRAKDKQRSDAQAWYQIDQIIKILNNGIDFLNFPDNYNLDDLMIPASEHHGESKNHLSVAGSK